MMFKPIGTKGISDNFYTIRTLFVNMYIYYTGDTYVAFDAGINKALLKSGLNKLKIDYNKITHVFLTHSDYDHAGGVNLFPNAKIYLSKEEEPLIKQRKARKFIMYNRGVKNCILLDNNQEIIIGDTNTRVKILSTPGHTIGSAIYTINDDILIGGDTISLNLRNEIGHFSFVQNMNHRMNIDMVKNLKEKNLFDSKSIIATGHHGVYKVK